MPTLYKDGLVELSDQELVFKNYYFPVGSRSIPLNDIESIQVRQPTLMNRWRLWGSDDLKTWFPNDWRRPSRDRVFFVTLRENPQHDSWRKRLLNSITGRSYRHIGFTVHDWQALASILEKEGLVRDQ